eukprot:symbB.v1.2.032399.t1/scaffold3828.1/size49577/2
MRGVPWSVLAVLEWSVLGVETVQFPVENRTLTELAEQLVRAKNECLNSTIDCLPALKQVRYRVWPFLQQLIHIRHRPFINQSCDVKRPHPNPKEAKGSSSNQPFFRPFEPTDFHPQVLKAKVPCNGVDNYSLIFQHTWKAAGWAVMENLRAISTDYTERRALEDNYRWCDDLVSESEGVVGDASPEGQDLHQEGGSSGMNWTTAAFLRE